MPLEMLLQVYLSKVPNVPGPLVPNQRSTRQPRFLKITCPLLNLLFIEHNSIFELQIVLCVWTQFDTNGIGLQKVGNWIESGLRILSHTVTQSFCVFPVKSLEFSTKAVGFTRPMCSIFHQKNLSFLKPTISAAGKLAVKKRESIPSWNFQQIMSTSVSNYRSVWLESYYLQSESLQMHLSESWLTC